MPNSSNSELRETPFKLIITVMFSAAGIAIPVAMILPKFMTASSGVLVDMSFGGAAAALATCAHFLRRMSRNIVQSKLMEQRALEENRKYEILLGTAGDGIHILDMDGRLAQVNDSFCRMLGYTPDEMYQLNLSDWANQLTLEQVCDRIHSLGEHSTTYETSYRHKDGRNIDVENNAVSIVQNGLPMLFCSARDITARKMAAARQQLAVNIFTHAREGIAITDTAGNIIDVNDEFCRITGYNKADVLGMNPRILKSGLQNEEFYASMWQAISENGFWSGEIWNRKKSGDIYAELLTISSVRDSDGCLQNYVAHFSDITAIKEHQQQIEHLAHHDALTGLPNRVLLADRLNQAIAQSLRRSQSLAVVYLDLDGFKEVNDRHGHSVGDQLLIAVTERMKSALREGDTLSRMGGDEFVAVLVDLARPDDCQPVLNRLLQATSAPVPVGNMEIQVSSSIGVTLFPQDGADAEQLMRHADQAMYQAKQAGKNRYLLFDVERDVAIQTRREFISSIRQAIDQSEFVLHYQPKVNMRTGKVIGVEALIRWQHPTRGLLMPSAFLPLIEDHPISISVGRLVIDTALKQISEWGSAGLDISISVNVTALQFQQPGFAQELGELLSGYPYVRPERLELEILETSALEDFSLVANTMNACRAMGIVFALDDFGTGYSSLTYLKRLPVDMLKIDQSFVQSMLHNSNDLSIVEGVIGLASSFHRTVIAEGVESEELGKQLLLMGCELAQGYAIAKPMPSSNFQQWINNWRPYDSWLDWQKHTAYLDNWTILFHEAEHRHWLQDLKAYLAGIRTSPPPMKGKECRTGRWLDTVGYAVYGDYPSYSIAVNLHDSLHSLGRELIRLHSQGHRAEALTKFERMFELRDDLISQLQLMSSASGAGTGAVI